VAIKSYHPAGKMNLYHIFTSIPFSEDFEIRAEAQKDLEDRMRQAPIDIKDALVSFKAEADQFQRKVIDSGSNTIRVVAPAGSGKTQTMINRVLFRIKGGINPNRLLVLTFDNAAATSLKTQLQGQLAELRTNVEGLRISTLNSFGYWILHKYVPREYKNVIPEYRPRRLLREILTALGDKSPERFAALPQDILEVFYLDFFSLLKNELFDPRNVNSQDLADFMLKHNQAEPFFPDPKNTNLVRKTIQAVIWLFSAYEIAMQRENVLDFDDQKLRSYLALQENRSLLGVIQSQYEEIIVDEFQDINKLDFVFIKALAEKASLVVTGDDDQAIYGFRGCTPEYIINLEKYLGRDITSYELQINYRCPKNLIEHTDKLIRHNKNRIPKIPIPHNQTTSVINVISSLSAALEAKFIVTYLKRIVLANPSLGFRDFVVLYRTNAQSLPLQVEFILNDIPFHVRKEDNILQNRILDRLLGVLRLKLALNSGRATRIEDQLLTIRAYFRYINEASADRLHGLFSSRKDFLSVIVSEEFFSIIPKAERSHLSIAIHEILQSNFLLDTLDILAKRFKGLKGMIGSLEDVVQERVPLGEIYDVAASFGGNISEFVMAMERALDLAKRRDAGRDEETGVGLLTYFRAKGRQWHSVILTSCNEGLIPHKRAPIEDERRLFYVALTRATSNLLISYLKDACRTKVSPSCFLKEAELL
jgi:DNA helicase-2/ATP-dependent DNA helicase PcrA